MKKDKHIKNKTFYGNKTREQYRSELESKAKKRTVIIIFSAVVVLFFVIIFSVIFTPNIIINGKDKVILNYKEKYKERGFTATYLGNDVTNDVKIIGKVNTKKLGTYKLKYVIKKGMFTKTINRIVIVKDLTAPKIELNEGKKVLVCPNEEYKEKGYKVIDNYDKDLEKKVKVTKDKNKYTYEVSDSSGNKTKISRKIIYGDREKPKITLNGGNKVYIYLNDKFTDPGIEISDNCDKDIKNKVKISSGINTKALGSYKITYIVTDASGNKEEVTREVEVIERGKNGTIYLTFDDGPKDGTTNVILDILKEQNVKATFFVTSYGPDNLIKREYDEGHTVALHTSSHNYAEVYSSVDAFFNDLNNVSKRVEKIIGKKSMLIRFPGGSSNTISRKYSVGLMSKLTDEVKKRGYRYYDWNLASGDSDGINDAEGLYQNVINHLSKDRVNMVLFHDVKPQTRDALRRIIEYGKQNGYTFDKITEKTEEIHQGVNN